VTIPISRAALVSDDQIELDRLTIAIIRALNALDREMEYLLHEASDPGATRSSGQRLKALRCRTGELSFSAKQRSQLFGDPEKIESALLIRNALVHGIPHFGNIEGELHFFCKLLSKNMRPPSSAIAYR
jgi:hypothetical protein